MRRITRRKGSQKEAQIFMLMQASVPKKRHGTQELGLKTKGDVQGIIGKLVTSNHVMHLMPRGRGTHGLVLW